METKKLPDIMSVTEAAEFLGVSTFTLRAYAKKGLVPAARIGRLWKFNRPDLIEYIKSQYNTNKVETNAEQVPSF